MNTRRSQRAVARIGAIALASALLLAACGGAAAPAASPSAAVAPPSDLMTKGVLTVGIDLSGPPLHFSQNGQPTGFDVDLAKALASRMGLTDSFQNQAFAGLLPGLNAHKFDVLISGVGITPDREKSFDFVSYFVAGVQLVGRKDKNIHINSSSEACGLTVATTSGSVEFTDLTAQNKQCPAGKSIDIKVYATFTEDLEQLKKGTVDVIYVDWPVAAYFVSQSPNDFILSSPIITGGPGPRHRDGIAMRKGDTAMKDAVSAALSSLKKDGTYKTLLTKWHLEGGDITASGS